MERPVLADTVVAVAAVIVGVLYLVAGNGYVLDDWFVLRDAHFGGAWEAGRNWRVVRPGGALVYSVVYGPGNHPAYVITVLTVLNVVAAVLLLRLLRRFVPPCVALIVAFLWVLLPMRTSVEVWAAASNIALSVLLALAALLALTDERSRPPLLAGGGLLCLVAGLTYESPVPALLLAAVVLPFLRKVANPRLAAGCGTAGCVAALAWTLSHPDPVKTRVLRIEDVGQVVGSVGGWGVVPRGAASSALQGVFLLLVVVVLARLVLSDWRPRTGLPEHLVVAGAVVAGVGVAPFLLYGYVPIGFGDRANAVISIGAALIWCGIGLLVWAWRREVAVGAMAILAVGVVVARAQRIDNWTTAGQDAAAIVTDIPRSIPDPPPTIVVGPRPMIRENVAAFLDGSNIDAATQLAYGTRDVRARMAFSSKAFERADPSIRYDLRTVSRLVPNMEIEPPGAQEDLAELPTR